MASDARYVELGLPCMKTFYTSLDFLQKYAYFAVSVTVTVQGQLKLYPPLLKWYLGFTVVVLPPIIVAACMSYHYCPRIRRRQRLARIQNLQDKLENQLRELDSMNF